MIKRLFNNFITPVRLFSTRNNQAASTVYNAEHD